MSGISRWLGPLVNSLKKEAVLNLGSAPDKPKLAINKWVYLLGKCSDQYEVKYGPKWSRNGLKVVQKIVVFRCTFISAFRLAVANSAEWFT